MLNPYLRGNEREIVILSGKVKVLLLLRREVKLTLKLALLSIQNLVNGSLESPKLLKISLRDSQAVC